MTDTRADYDSELYGRLRDIFPGEAVYSRKAKGGVVLDYIPYAYVVDRLNDALGVFGWSHEVLDMSTAEDKDGETHMISTVRLHLHGQDGLSSFRDGIGGKCLTDKAARGMALGDLYKTAVADALKKAAQSAGVALYLSLDEETDDDYEEVGQSSDDTDSDIIPQEWYDQFVEAAAATDEDVRAEVKRRWAELVGTDDLGAHTMTHSAFQELVPYMKSLTESADSEE